MNKKSNEKTNIKFLLFSTSFFALLFLGVSFAVFFLLPSNSNLAPQEPQIQDAFESLVEVSQNQDNTELFSNPVADSKARLATKKADEGLSMYRDETSKVAVEWFYTSVTENRDVAVAILKAAEKQDISLSLAFALAYTESKYNVNAVNRNRDASIDRGLFQLNNRSFPRIKEAEFFDPYLSANYGMQHLRFCLDTAGNEIAALAMYNAGTNKVRNDNTPQITLNYVATIMNYRHSLDAMFEDEVVSLYKENKDTRLAKKI